MDEFDIIRQFFAPLATSPAAAGLRDDAAFLPWLGNKKLVITTDAMVEGVHFLASDPAEMVAQKLLRVNLSDLAAKAAAPRYYCLTCVLPSGVQTEWLERFSEGLAADQAAYGLTLLGGDTVRTPGPLTLSITAFGECERPIRRSGAQPGDGVYVTGTIGDAALGLRVLQNRLTLASSQDMDYVTRRYRLPQPRIEAAHLLAKYATSAADVSDGLLADVAHIAEAAETRITLWHDAVPLSEAAQGAVDDGEASVMRLAAGGDDYEVVFTAPARSEKEMFVLAQKMDVPITRIGDVTAGQGIAVVDSDGQPISIERMGFNHFGHKRP